MKQQVQPSTLCDLEGPRPGQGLRVHGSRRSALAAIASALVPAVTGAQGSTFRIAVVMGSPENDRGRAMVAAFRTSLRELGWADGQRVNIRVWWGGANAALMLSNAEELIRGGFDVHVVQTATALRNVLRIAPKTKTVFWAVSDPVSNGFVRELARPGGSVTGFSLYSYDMAGKWLELLRETVPTVTSVFALMGADNVNLAGWRTSLQEASARSGLRIIWNELRGTADVAAALTQASSTPNSSVLALADPFMSQDERSRLVSAHAHKVPIIAATRRLGGQLLTYEVDQMSQARDAARYVSRILHGERPGDLPVQAPQQFRLTVDRRASRALGITVPHSVLLRADEVVD